MARESTTSNNAKMKRKDYEKELRKLQVELCHLQDWVKSERRTESVVKRTTTLSSSLASGGHPRDQRSERLEKCQSIDPALP